MALDYKATYPLRYGTGTAAFPQGVPQNVTFQNDGTGSPWEASTIKDFMGFFQGLVAQGLITPNGVFDTATDSDYIRGMLALCTAVPMNEKRGLRIVQTGGFPVTQHEIRAGSVRNQADTHNLVHAATLTKGTGTWIDTASLGGVADGVTPGVDTWVRGFLVKKSASETTSFVWDTDVAAANFFGSTNAIIDGYTNATLYRRITWDFFESATEIRPVLNSEVDTKRFLWNPATVLNLGLVLIANVTTGGPRAVVDISKFAPPSTRARMVLDFTGNVADALASVAITESAQQDVDATFMGDALSAAGVTVYLKLIERDVGTGSTVFHRVDGNPTNLNFTTLQARGWTDTLSTP